MPPELRKEAHDFFHACAGAFVAAVGLSAAQYAGAHVTDLLHYLGTAVGGLLGVKTMR